MKKKGIAYRRLLASFSTAILLPSCIMVVFFFFSSHVINKQIEESSSNLLQTVQNVSDEELSLYNNILVQFSSDDGVKRIGTLMQTDGTEFESLNGLQEKLIESLVLIDRLDGGCEEVFLYFPKIDKVISSKDGVMRFSVYAANHCRNQDEIVHLTSSLENSNDTSAQRVPSDVYGENAQLLTRACWKRSRNCDAYIGMWVDPNAFSKQIASVDWEYGFEWAIVNQEGQIVKSATNSLDEQISAYATSSRKIKGYIVNSAQSRENDWRYILLIPEKSAETAAAPLRVFFGISITLCVILGSFITTAFTKVNYKPIDNTMQYIRQRSEAHEEPVFEQNEYQYIRQQVEHLVSTRQSLQTSLNKKEKKEKNWILGNLLTRPLSFEISSPNMEKTVAPFLRGQNIVVLIREKIRLDDQCELDATLKQFVVDNVFTELLSKHYVCQIVNLDGIQAMIVHADDFTENTELLQETILEFQAVLQEKLGFSVAVAVGGIHEGLRGIHESYLETRETEEFLDSLDQDYIAFDDIRDKALRKYSYSVQSEELLFTALQNDDAELATAFINRILESMFQNSESSSVIRKLMLMDIYCTLLKVADEKGTIDKIHISLSDIEDMRDIDALKAKYAAMVGQICIDKSEGAEYSANIELCRNVRAYIENNYADPNLNVSTVALHFHVSPSTLSAVYKKESGQGLLKVINETRINKAAELLKKGCSVSETAQNVGIMDSSTFIRLFKKHMGLTPGQYKANFKA